MNDDDDSYFDPDAIDAAAAPAVPPDPEVPRYFYDEDCDSLELIFRNADHKAQPLDERLTFLVERTSPQQIVGLIVKRVREFIHEVVSEWPGFQQEYQDRTISFESLLKAIQWKNKDAEIQAVLHKLSQTVSNMPMIVLGELCGA